MASPLRWFRRHAKILMVVLGSAAMAIFGLGPVFDTLSRGSNRSVNRENEVLARWKGGEINRDDVAIMQAQHYQTQRFLNALQKNARDIKKDEFQPIAQPIQPIREGEQGVVDEQLISRFILSKKAEAEGIVVSDGVIDDYLGMASGFAGFSKNDLVQINQEANQGGCSVENVRRHIRLELLAQQMQLLAGTGMVGVPNPVEAISMYHQISERVECEVLPISVDDYLAKIEETPSKLELKKLYEEGKFEYPDPTGKSPGFKIRNKVKVQYLTAEFETFVQNEMNKLTDEQVQTEYNRLVEMESDLVMEVVPVDTDDAIKMNDPPPTLPGAESDATDSAPAGVEPPPETDSTAALESNSPETPAEKPDVDAAEEVESGETDNEPADDEPVSPEVDADDSDSQSLNVRRRKMQLVSLPLQDDGEQVAEEPKNSEPESTTETTNEESVQQLAETATAEAKSVPDETVEAKSADEEPANTSPAADQPNDEKTAGSTSEQTAEADDANSPDAKSDGASDDESDEIGSLLQDEPRVERRVLPLQEVAEKIKREMVKDAAAKAVEDAVKKVTATLTSYHTLHMRWELTDEKKRGAEPDPIDAKSIADKYNLIADETALVDEVQLSETSFGRIQIPIPVRRPDGTQSFSFPALAVIVFDRFDAIKVYDPLTAKDFMNGNTHVYWLSEKQDARIPEFDECEPEIVKFWKSRRALELALAEAEKIAATVNSQQKTLTELYGETVSQTGEFTWFNTFGQTAYGQPIGVISPGPEFMKATFALEKMQAGVAANQPKDIVYVLQMLSERQPLDKLGSDYLENQFFRFKTIPRDVSAVSQIYYREMNLDWNQELADEMDLKIYGR